MARVTRSTTVVDDDIPGRLRAARERHDLTVRELARRLDLSPSSISQIELGRVRPSVATLWAIVNELGMSMDELFGTTAVADPRRQRSASGGDAAVQASSATETDIVVRADSRKAITLSTGVRWESLAPHLDPGIDFVFVRYDPGGSSNPDGTLVRHAGREWGLVLTGRLEVTVGFGKYLLGPGDAIAFDSTTPHLLSNVGDEPVTGVWCTLGRDGVPPSISGEARAGHAAGHQPV